MKFEKANTYIIQCMGQGISLKNEKITHDLNHDLIFYCTHNQLCVPQYKFFLNYKLYIITHFLAQAVEETRKEMKT